jgi:hypothetical protein
LCIIYAKEERDVAVINIPNAFIQKQVEDKEDMAIIKIHGVLVDIIVQIAPDVYKSYVTTDKNGMKQLLVHCQNALYGTMVASLLYYCKFTKSLTSVGFEINLYDSCVANKTVNGTQMTICFHVDDCKLSHCISRANDNMIDWLQQEYESIFEDDWNKLVHLMKYLRKGCRVSQPLVAKTLYATKQARPDTCTAIAFLTMRVQVLDKDDWNKVVHLMKYLRGTHTLPLILSANGTGILKWWVDAGT